MRAQTIQSRRPDNGSSADLLGPWPILLGLVQVFARFTVTPFFLFPLRGSLFLLEALLPLRVRQCLHFSPKPFDGPLRHRLR